MGKKSTFKQLRAVSQKLPQYLQPTKVRISGKDILKKNPLAKMVDGTPIEADKFYLADSFIPKNHYRALKKAYKKGGHKEAVEYFKAIADSGASAIQGQMEIRNGINERASLIPFGL